MGTQAYLRKPETSQSGPKPAKTRRNQTKRTKTSPNNLKLQNDPKRPKISKLGKSGIFFKLSFFKYRPEFPNLGILCQKVSTF